MKLVREFVTWSAASGTLRASALNHELRNDPVKSQPIIEIPLLFLANESQYRPAKSQKLRTFLQPCSSVFSPKFIFMVHDPGSPMPPTLITHVCLFAATLTNL